jgi:hypothetical protein
MPLIIPANTLSSGGGFAVDNSLRFNSGSSDRLTKTFSGSGTSDKIMTFSFWCKKTIQSGWSYIIHNGQSDGDPVCVIGFEDNFLKFNYYVGGSTLGRLKTNRLFRDVSSWYHVVVAIDTTQATSSNRIKFYVNGVQETSFSQSDYPSLNRTITLLQGTDVHTIGASAVPDDYFSGYLTEFVAIDGTALDATSFGEFDEDSGIWKPINVSGLTFGTNGFYLDFENSGSLGADVSGNGNNFTVNNLTAIDQTTDTPTNNFATLNPLNGVVYSSITFSEGNLKAQTTAGKYAPAHSTMGFNTGKWYAEFKATDAGNWTMVGIVAQNSTASGQPLGYFSDSYGYIGGSSAGGSNSLMNNDTNTSYASTYGNGDIISIAVDCDNNKLYFGLNGTWLNSGDPESGASGTGSAFTISATPSSGFYYFAVGNYSGSQTPDWEANFGSPPYAISSGNTDGNGYGNFEYAVPSGYL